MIRRAIVSTLLAAAFFTATTGPLKQVKALYAHAPWVNDPYDAAVSFAMFFVPILAACCLGRVLLCRTGDELPAARVIDLLRGCRVVLGLIVVTLLAQWAALAAGANSAQRDGGTWAQVAVIAAATVLVARAVADLRRAPVAPLRPSAGRRGVAEPGAVEPGAVEPEAVEPAGRQGVAEPGVAEPGVEEPGVARPAGRPGAAAAAHADWLADAVALGAAHSGRLGPLARPAQAVLAVADRQVAARIRRHPVLAAITCSILFAAVVGGWQALREGYALAAALLTIMLLACGCFALLTAAGGYLGFVRGEKALGKVPRRVLDASVAASATMLAVLAFRDSLWWVVGSSSAVAGTRQFAVLLGVAALTCFGVVLGAETALGSHAVQR